MYEKIFKKLKDNGDLVTHEFYLGSNKLNLIHNEVLCSSDFVNHFILMKLTALSINANDDVITFLYNNLPDNTVKVLTKEKEMLDYIYKGFVLIIYQDKAIAIEAKASLDRGINDASSEITIRGSKDAFNENFNTNLGLIRRRLRSENCFTESFFLGKESRTKTGIVYMKNIASLNTVNKVKSILKNIKIDGVIDSGMLKSYLEDDKNFLFPTVLMTERPDRVSQALLEGKVCIVVDNSPYVLITPSFFIDFLHTPDDYYQKAINVSFIRVIRLLAFIISIFTPAIYIALTTHNQEALPLSFLLNFMAQRQSVPFSALTEALFMSISFEILRESDIRKQSSTGSAVSILGGLILGDAAVSAGIISPIMIIVISISAISGLAFSSQEMIASLRWLRFLMMFLAMFFGIFGIYIGFLFLLSSLVTTKALNYPYFAPFSPLIKEELGDTIIKLRSKKRLKRNPLLTKNKKRGS